MSSRSIEQEVGYYLYREGPNLGKHRVPRLLLPSILDAYFGTPYPRSAGFDTDIGAFIESSTVTSKKGLMARLVIEDNITSGGALASCQTLRLGGFVMTARSAAAPMMTYRVIKNNLHICSEYAEQWIQWNSHP